MSVYLRGKTWWYKWFVRQIVRKLFAVATTWLPQAFGYGTDWAGTFTRRIVGFALHHGVVDGMALCRMFNRAIHM